MPDYKVSYGGGGGIVSGLASLISKLGYHPTLFSSRFRETVPVIFT